MRHDKFDWSGYFEWLVDIVDDGEHDDMLPVLSYLWKKEFDYSNLKPLDKNRASDGIALREHYAEDYNCKITEEDLEEPCSVLECLVRLAVDIENHVTGIPGEERPDIWFWKFLENLGIDERCEGRGYDKGYLDQCIDTWLDGDISKHGRRSPFRCKNPNVDMKKKDIWMQAMAMVNDRMRYW